MSWLAIAYAAVAYRLFWLALAPPPVEVGEESAALILGRAVLYLTLGPILLAGVYLASALIVLFDPH